MTHAPRSNISEIKSKIVDGFIKNLGGIGCIAHPPATLIPESDPSVLFTGSTISTFKPYFECSPICPPGYFLVQDCLRTQNAAHLINDDAQIEWSSFFSSVGSISAYCQLDDVVQAVWTLFTDSLEIKTNRLLLRVNSSDKELSTPWERLSSGGCIEYDSRPLGYYKHSFGIPGVSGRNANISIKDLATGIYNDVGNIIIIERGSTPLAVEAAFGVETIASRTLGLKNPLHATVGSFFIPMESNYSEKLCDAINASISISRAGVRPVATNRGRVLRKYLQGISYLLKKLQISLCELRDIIAQVELAKYHSRTNTPHAITTYISRYEEQLSSGAPPCKANEIASRSFCLSNSPYA